METKFKVVKITNDIEEYPDCEEDTKNHPDLIEDVEDEMEIFVIDINTDTVYRAADFFYMTNLKHFKTFDSNKE